MTGPDDVVVSFPPDVDLDGTPVVDAPGDGSGVVAGDGSGVASAAAVPEVPLEAPEADVLEQAQVVPFDDDDRPR